MGYRRWTPSSRRDRRRYGRPRRGTTRGTDKVFLVVMGLFCLAAILFLAALALLDGG
jgi:hypothetical protein